MIVETNLYRVVVKMPNATGEKRVGYRTLVAADSIRQAEDRALDWIIAKHKHKRDRLDPRATKLNHTQPVLVEIRDG